MTEFRDTGIPAWEESLSGMKWPGNKFNLVPAWVSGSDHSAYMPLLTFFLGAQPNGASCLFKLYRHSFKLPWISKFEGYGLIGRIALEIGKSVITRVASDLYFVAAKICRLPLPPRKLESYDFCHILNCLI
jgi:hypothetical protein